MGCSTAGEIAGGQVNDASISVAVACFKHTLLRRAYTHIDSAADSYAAGARLAEQLAGDSLRAVFVLSDGLCVNGTPLVAGLSAGLPPGVAITGGWPATAVDSRAPGCWIADSRRATASAP